MDVERKGSAGSSTSSSATQTDLREQFVKNAGNSGKGSQRKYQGREKAEKANVEVVRDVNARLANPYFFRSDCFAKF